MEIDKENMRQVIINSPKQFVEGLKLAENVKIDGDFKNIVVCGMGGSALPTDILLSINKINIPLYIHRNYNLPPVAHSDSLIICISYSGNTEEVTSALKEAINKNLKIVSIASGGEIEKICLKNNIPLIKIPNGIQPRSATGYIFSAFVKLLENLKIIRLLSNEVLKTAFELEKINKSLEEDGQKLAKKLINKIPLIYSADNFKSVAKIWKIKFNENSKISAFYNYFPELNHNEMVGFSGIDKNSNFHFIILKDFTEHQRILKRMDLFTKFLKKKGVKVDLIEIKNGSLLFKIFSTLLLGDWVSYYLAIENKIDPTPVQMVEEFKKLLKK